MIAIIGGSGLYELQNIAAGHTEAVQTDYADEPVEVFCGIFQNQAATDPTFCFLPRHGTGHTIPPHRINYRANIKALGILGVEGIIAVNAVGGLNPAMGPGVIAIPQQIIDYSWGREHTFFRDGDPNVTHIDFTNPYDENLRAALLAAAVRLELDVWPQGVYACTQGPRLETSAEIQRLRRDGCDMVGMTGMPEAALARELAIPYASLALSVNWAAGTCDKLITMEAINEVLAEGMFHIQALLLETVTAREST